jgi:pimeloyl-ACP methyl ester carboxylesterase
MGGKVAMKFALTYPQMLEKLVVVDIAPRPYPVHHGSILQAFQEVRLDGKAKRGEVEEELKDYIDNFGVRQFIMKNLYRRSDNSFAWRINMDAIANNIGQVGEEITSEVPFDKPTLFVGGSKSDYITMADQTAITNLFPSSKLEYVQDAGHWVHAEQPKAFMEVLVPFL